MRKLIKATSLLTSASLVEMIFRFVRTKLIAVFLGTQGLGFLSQFGNLLETLRSYGTIGTRRAVIRQVASAKESGVHSQRYGEVIKTSFFLVLLASGLIAFVTTVFSVKISHAIFGDERYYLFVVILSCMLPVVSISTLLGAIVKGNLEYRSFAYYNVVCYLVTILVTWPAIYFFKYWGAVFTNFLFFALPVIGYFIMNERKHFLNFSHKINFTLLKEQFHDGFNCIYEETLAGTLKLIVMSWITVRLGFVEMGIYQVVMAFTTVYLVIGIHSSTGYTLPTIASAKDWKQANDALNNTVRLLIFLLSPVIILLLMIPEIFIEILYSKEFLPAIPVLRIQLLGSFFITLGTSFYTYLMAKGKMKPLYIAATIHPVSYFVLCWLFFERGKLFGVAWGFTIAAFIAMVANFWLAKHYFQIKLQANTLLLIITSFLWILAATVVTIYTHSLFFDTLLLAVGLPWFFIVVGSEEKKFLFNKLGNFLKKS